jgi:hypothetical protein
MRALTAEHDGYNEPCTNITVSPRNRDFLRLLKSQTAKHFGLSKLTYFDFFNLLEKEISKNDDLKSFVQKIFNADGI